MMTRLEPIPFSKPIRLDKSLEYVTNSLESGFMSGDGPFTKSCEAKLTSIFGATTKLVSSATHALDMMGILANLNPGDEVICPSFTFVSTANAFVLRGANIKFADCDRHGNIRLDEIVRLKSKKTKVVVTMNYGGTSPDYDPILEFCSTNNIILFEDAAQSIGAFYKNRPLGTFGDLACFSFHETKNINCGEGGALLINKKHFLERAEIIREKGTNRTQFLQGLVDKYSWVDVGSSFLMPEMAAAYLLPQIEDLTNITNKRAKNWHVYFSELSSVFQKADAEIIDVPAYNQSNYHIFGFLLPKNRLRSDFIKFMKSNSITTPFHYLSLHLSPFGREHFSSQQSLPMTERLSNQLVRLPIYYSLSEEEQSRVIESVKIFFEQ